MSRITETIRRITGRHTNDDEDDDEADEEYIFIHDNNDQIKFEIPKKKDYEFNFLNDDIFTKEKNNGNNEDQELKNFEDIKLQNYHNCLKLALDELDESNLNENVEINHNFMENICEYTRYIDEKSEERGKGEKSEKREKGEESKYILFPLIKKIIQFNNNQKIVSTIFEGLNKLLEIISLSDKDNSFILDQSIRLMKDAINNKKPNFHIENTIKFGCILINRLTQNEFDNNIKPFLNDLEKNKDNKTYQKILESVYNSSPKFFDKKANSENQKI